MHSAISPFISHIFSTFGISTPDRHTIRGFIEVNKIKNKWRLANGRRRCREAVKREISGGKAMRDGRENKKSR